ncbi:histidine phosphatase superfamily [Leucosporidium creatinivorum]|uniref:Phosphoglycerate mutase n=1 Tax=Leucosporidium creatinivorum TaxID=106004 RepID=A0A1Y2FA10_9BASI|nr:histidine phosphatase superfamily [Leucosporidium creatinivorum]
MDPANNLLVIIRHGQSETNASGIFTGLLDPPLTHQGRDEALSLGHFLLDRYPPTSSASPFTHAYTSPLQRASTTLEIILSAFPAFARPAITVTPALNERDYGQLNGRSKKEVAEEYGAEQTEEWRRGYEAAPPGGESLEMTVKRVWRYYEEEIRPRLLKGERLLVVSHGNTLRGLVMALERLGPDEVKNVELGYTATRCYSLDGEGKVKGKELFVVNGVEGGWSQ